MGCTKKIIVATDFIYERKLFEEIKTTLEHKVTITFMETGEKIVDFLMKLHSSLHPDLIIVDMDMEQEKDQETIKALKMNPEFKRIPVIAYSQVDAEEYKRKLYALGVNSYLLKSSMPDHLSKAFPEMIKYWFEVVTLPTNKSAMLCP